MDYEGKQVAALMALSPYLNTEQQDVAWDVACNIWDSALRSAALLALTFRVRPLDPHSHREAHHRRRLRSYRPLRATTDDDTGAAFVCFCLEKAGFSSRTSARVRDYEHYGVPGDGSYGDIAVFRAAAGSSGAGYVGFVDRIEDDSIYVLGGNQSKAVNITRMSRSQPLHFRRWPSDTDAQQHATTARR